MPPLKKGPGCVGCPLEHLGEGFSEPDGTGEYGVMLLGEALGQEEVEAGRPFVGRAGKHLNRILRRTKDPETGESLQRGKFLIENVLRCRPPENKLSGMPYEEGAIAHCAQYREKTIKEHQPRVIVALGGTAQRVLTGHVGVEKLRGYVFKTPFGPILSTFHPSHLIRQGKREEGAKGKVFLSPVVQFDLLKALHIARHGEILSPPKHYILNPTVYDVIAFRDAYFKALREDPSTVLFYDIETPHVRGGKEKDEDSASFRAEDDPSFQTIYRISLSFRPYVSITIVWQPPFVAYVKEMLSTEGPKAAWNEQFDSRRLAYHGAPVKGRVYDPMQLFHFLRPNLPMSLAFVAPYYCPEMEAWKLASRESPEYYSAADSDVGLRCFLGVKKDLVAAGRWEMAERHVVDMLQVLRKIGQRGVRTDLARRKIERERFEKRFLETIAGLQPLIPLALKPKKIYRSLPEAVEKQKLKKPELAAGQWVIVQEEVSEVKVGWEIAPDGFLRRIPKPPKEKKPRKGRKKKGEEALNGDSGNGPSTEQAGGIRAGCSGETPNLRNQ